jgi:hypothetical protein
MVNIENKNEMIGNINPNHLFLLFDNKICETSRPIIKNKNTSNVIK